MKYARLNRYFLVTPAAIGFLLACVTLPPFPELAAYRSRPTSRVVVDRDGSPLFISTLPDGTRRRYLPLENIPTDAWHLFLDVEDKKFFVHPGVDPIALIRAIFQNVGTGRTVSGASTITMQLARMMSPRPAGEPYTPIRTKIKEIFAALRIEAKLTKREILELWINGLPFGYQTEGIASAANRFFGVDVLELTLPQMLSLSLIPRNPTLYNPIRNPEEVTALIWRLSAGLGLNLDRNAVVSGVASAQWGQRPDKAPHFARYMLSTDKDEGNIITSLDLGLQSAAETILHVYLRKWLDSRIQNGAILLIDNIDGSILAYVGSQNFYDFHGGQIDGVRVANQPGSTLKPFLYAFALENGYSPADVMADIPREFGAERIYVPRNFNELYHGPVRLRTSLSSSLNVPAVALLERLGVREFADYLVSFGFESIGRGRIHGYPAAGLGIALGNTPVTLLELVRGFSIFAREGEYLDISGYSGHAAPRRVMSPGTASTIFDILADPFERSVGFGAEDPFRARFRAAVKTGTSSQNQNIWALASTNAYTVGVWLGNFSGETVIGRTGSSIPARIALELLDAAERLGDASRIPAFTGSSAPRIEICTLSGMAAGTACPATRLEITGTANEREICTYHRAGEDQTRYPSAFAPWLTRFDKSGEIEPRSAEQLRIIYPSDRAMYYFDQSIPAAMQGLRIEVLHSAVSPPALSVNGKPVGNESPGGADSSGYTSWIIPLVPGNMRIEVRSDTLTAIRTVTVR